MMRSTLLRVAGIEPWAAAALTDDRWSITVTRHAIARADERYGCSDPLVILADVALALREGRRDRQAPTGYYAWGNRMTCVWTLDEARVYVLRRSRGCWFVVSALPAEKKTKAERRRKRDQARLRLVEPPRSARDLHPHGVPAVGAALERAGITKEPA